MPTVADMRQRLVDGDLVSARMADEFVRRWQELHKDNDNGVSFVRWLADDDVITPFQASALQAGHSAPFLLGPYRVFDRLARSEMGNIYRAVHAELDHPVSLKVFSSSLEKQPVLFTRMQREARASVELDHPNVLSIFQIGRVGSIYFLASQNLTGESLEDWLDRDGRLNLVPACKLIRQVALGLQHIHEKCMAHRNITPHNLWINDQGTVTIVGLDCVCDTDGSFGIDDASQAAAKSAIGTPACMAPEQARQPEQPDPRSDVYALGCVFYHCLSGRGPFESRQTVADVDATVMPVPIAEAAPDVPEPVAQLVDSMLSADPDSRPGLDEVIATSEAQLDPAELDIVEEDAIPAELLDWLQTSEDGGKETLFEGTDFTDWLAEE